MNEIEKCIHENIKNPEAIFVFSTQIVADAWADYALTHTDIIAFSMERFIAWDTFKKIKLNAQQETLYPVTIVMRKLFAENLIAQNAKKPFFKSLIPVEYAQSAQAFSSWIASILPQLSILNRISIDTQKLELFDYLTIKNAYQAFLEKNTLSEPSWIASECIQDEKTYFLFLPQLHSDFSEYREILEEEKNIALVYAKNYQPALCVHEYETSREELKALCNTILQLHYENHVDFSEIAVNIPGIEIYSPYLFRDFYLYGIPYVFQSGEKLGKTGAGIFFSLIHDCFQNNFSFASLKSFLLNEQFPWSDESKRKNKLLIAFGIKNHCVCSYKIENSMHSAWEDAFKINRHTDLNLALSKYFSQISSFVTKFGKAQSFSQILTIYFDFRRQFFESDLLQDETTFAQNVNLILSRCVEELRLLISLEIPFAAYLPQNPFAFFIGHLNDTQYQPKTMELGVHIFPYGVAAASPFAYQFVLHCTQSNVTVIHKKYAFLFEETRRFNEITDINVSPDFLKSYALASKQTIFSSAKKSVSQYENVHSFFEKKRAISQVDFAYETIFCFPKDKNGLEYKRRLEAYPENCQISAQTLQQRIKKVKYTQEALLKISASDLNTYFSCPIRWFFERILFIPRPEVSDELLNSLDIGAVYHLILKILFEKIQSTKKPLQPENSMEYEQFLWEAIVEALESQKIIHDPIQEQLIFARKNELFRVLFPSIKKLSQTFCGFFVYCLEKEYEKKRTVHDKAFLLKGFIDAQLYDVNGEMLTIIDYKKSRMPTKASCIYNPAKSAILENFQMATYVSLCDEVCENALFFSIKDAKEQFIIKNDGKFKPSREEFEETLAFFEQKCFQYYTDIENSDLTIKSPYTLSKPTCVSCPYSVICRTTFYISGKIPVCVAKW